MYNAELLKRSLKGAARFGALMGTLVVAAGNEAGPTVSAGAPPYTTAGLGELAKKIWYERVPELVGFVTSRVPSKPTGSTIEEPAPGRFNTIAVTESVTVLAGGRRCG